MASFLVNTSRNSWYSGGIGLLLSLEVSLILSITPWYTSHRSVSLIPQFSGVFLWYCSVVFSPGTVLALGELGKHFSAQWSQWNFTVWFFHPITGSWSLSQGSPRMTGAFPIVMQCSRMSSS